MCFFKYYKKNIKKKYKKNIKKKNIKNTHCTHTHIGSWSHEISRILDTKKKNSLHEIICCIYDLCPEQGRELVQDYLRYGQGTSQNIRI